MDADSARMAALCSLQGQGGGNGVGSVESMGQRHSGCALTGTGSSKIDFSRRRRFLSASGICADRAEVANAWSAGRVWADIHAGDTTDAMTSALHVVVAANCFPICGSAGSC